MLIGETYKIESDSLNVILYKKASKEHARSKKDSPENWVTEGYFSNVKNAGVSGKDGEK